MNNADYNRKCSIKQYNYKCVSSRAKNQRNRARINEKIFYEINR